MVRAKYKITGRVYAGSGGGGTPIYPELEDLEISPSANEQHFKSNKYGFNNVLVNPVTVKEHRLEGRNLVLVLQDDSILNIDMSSYIDSELTEEQIEAINNMSISINNNELVFEYDETVLDFNFSLENDDLIVNNMVNGTDFNINQNGEMEVMY